MSDYVVMSFTDVAVREGGRNLPTYPTCSDLITIIIYKKYYYYLLLMPKSIIN